MTCRHKAGLWLIKKIIRGETCVQIKKQQLELVWFQIGKGGRQGCILSPAYMTSMQSTSCRMLEWVKHKLEPRLLGEISMTSDKQMTPHYGRQQEPFDESERGEWKSWLKTPHSENKDQGIWSHHFMGNRWGNSVRLYFWGLQNHCRLWLLPWNWKTFTPWKKSYDKPR